MLKKYSSHVLYQYLTAIIPFVLLPYLYNNLGPNEFIAYASLATLSSLLLLLDMRLGVVVINAAARVALGRSRSNQAVLDYLYSYYCAISFCVFSLVILLGPFFSHYMSGETSYVAVLLYTTIPIRLMVGFYRSIYFGTGLFSWPNKIMFWCSLLKLSGLFPIAYGIQEAFSYFCLLYFLFSIVEFIVLKSKVTISLKFSFSKEMFHYIKSTGVVIFCTALISYLIQTADRFWLPGLIGSDDYASFLLLSSLTSGIFFALNPFSSIINRGIASASDALVVKLSLITLGFGLIGLVITHAAMSWVLDDALVIILSERFSNNHSSIFANLLLGNILFYLYGVLYFVAVSKGRVNTFLLFNFVSLALYGILFVALRHHSISYEEVFSRSWMLVNGMRVVIFYPILLYSIFGYLDKKMVFAICAISLFLITSFKGL